MDGDARSDFVTHKMNELSYQACTSLIEALQKGVRTMGILRAVNRFGKEDNNPANITAKSVSKSFENSIQGEESICRIETQLELGN